MLGHNGKLVAMTDREQARRNRLGTEAARALLRLVSLAGGLACGQEVVSHQEVRRAGAVVGRTLSAIAEVAAADAVRDARQRGADAIDAKVSGTVHAMGIIGGCVSHTIPAATEMAESSAAEVRRDVEAVN